MQPSQQLHYGNLQQLCKSIGRWGTLNCILCLLDRASLDSWIKIDQLDVTCFCISLFNTQHVSDVSTSILRSLRLICWVISWVVLLWFDVCWGYVVVWLWWCGIGMPDSEWRNSGSDRGRTGKDFPKYGATGSILSGRKWFSLPAHVVMSSHFLHNAVSPLQISLQYPH